jgi:preprotein translocase subunit YajC
MSDITMRDWILTHKKLLIPTALATVLVFVLFSVALLVQHKRQQEREHAAAEKAAALAEKARQQLPEAQGAARHGKPADLPPEMIPEREIPAYATEPSPAEVIDRIEAIDRYERREEAEKFKGILVVWPLYFFSARQQGQDTLEMSLDASEDGFGVIIVCQASLKKYPDLATLQPGDKIWLAGKISEIDTNGTGQITVVTDYIGFSGKKPQQVDRPEQ